MKNSIATVLLLFIFSTGKLLSQNLVPNYSFENEVSCFLQNAGWATPEIDWAIGWSLATEGTADHYDPCHTGGFGSFTPPNNWFGYAVAQDGQSYGGLMTYEQTTQDYKEYMQIQLSSPLVAGNTYSIGFYHQAANDNAFMTDGLGMLVQSGPVSSPPFFSGVLSLTPQIETTTVQSDTANWTLLSGTFVATGGEDYVVIGSFVPDGAMTIVPTGTGSGAGPKAYYYIDSVFVEEVCSPDITVQDFCDTDPVTILNAVVSGTWSGSGITNPATGEFNPAIAGVGVHQIVNTITGACAGSDTVMITVAPVESATISYPATDYCIYDNDPTASVQGTVGGSFSIDGGGVINPTTGQVDLDQTGGGVFVVSYVTPGICYDSATVTLTIGPSQSATITPVNALCENAGVIDLQPSSNGIWTGNGITNASTGVFDPAVAGVGNHTVIHTISENGCTVADSITVEVLAENNSGFSYPSQVYCFSDPDPIATITGLLGGLFSIDNGGVMNTATGEIYVVASGIGTYNVTYTTNGPCPTSTVFSLEIVSTPDASISPAGPLCETESPVTLQAVTSGGTWTGTGITDPVLGNFDPQVAGPGLHTVVYTISGNCSISDSIDILVNPVNSATFSYSQGVYLISDSNPTPTVSGGAGGMFSIDNGGVIDPTTGEIDIQASGVGLYTITYTSPNPCGTTLSTTVLIDELPDPPSAPTLTVPNVFTPNNDGANDYFIVTHEFIAEFNGQILNRWGNVIFSWNDVSVGWNGNHNGTQASEGTYFYIIRATGEDGTELIRQGNLYLSRD